jgi:hypothetical protein
LPRAAEVGEFEVQSPDVVVVRDCSARGDPELCEEAVPLGNGGPRVLGEVETGHDCAVLPATVCGGGRPAEQVGAVRRVTDPFAAGVNRIDGEGHRVS